MYVTLRLNQVHYAVAMLQTYGRNGFSHHGDKSIGGATVRTTLNNLITSMCNYTDLFKIQDKFKLFVSNLTIFKVPLKACRWSFKLT